MEIAKHKRGNFYAKEKNTIEEAVLTMMEETCMTNSGKFTTNTWIGDTGATSHMTNSDKGLMNVQIINERIKMGNGKFMVATKKGILPPHLRMEARSSATSIHTGCTNNSRIAIRNIA